MSSPTDESPPVAALALRSWLRYVVPLTSLSLLAYGGVLAVVWLASAVAAALQPIVLIGAAVAPTPAADAAAIHAQLHAGWILAGGAWIVQLALVGAAIPAVRALATGAPLSQRCAALAGVLGLARALAPCTIAVLAVALGGVALVVPGLALIVLFAFAGASAEAGLLAPAALTDSVAVARAHLRVAVIVVACMLALDLGIAFAAQRAIVVPLAKPTLAMAHGFVRVVALALIGTSALPACALAAVYAKR